MDDSDVRQWGVQITRFFAKRVNAQEREDLCQETWYLLVQLQQRGKVLTPQLVSIVCHSVWVDYLRTRHKQDENELPLQGDCACVDWEAESILRMDVHSALLHLPPAERELILRYYLFGDTCAQIAQMLGVTEAVVQKRLQRARARLRRHLRGYEGARW